jgi:hypothetical protein
MVTNRHQAEIGLIFRHGIQMVYQRGYIMRMIAHNSDYLKTPEKT